MCKRVHTCTFTALGVSGKHEEGKEGGGVMQTGSAGVSDRILGAVSGV